MTTTTTTTLADFLLARIAEDEAAVVRDKAERYGNEAALHLLACGLNDYNCTRCDCGHPARALAEVAAKRAIVEAYIDEGQRMDIYNRGYDNGQLTTQSDLRSRLSSNARWAGLDIAARYLVQVYADHPDFNSRWLPENW